MGIEILTESRYNIRRKIDGVETRSAATFFSLNSIVVAAD